MIKLAGPGWAVVGIGLVLAILPAAVSRSFWWALPGLGFALFAGFFFRDPEREVRADPSVAYSPADGVVMSVEKEGSGAEKTLRIFLSIADVHVQRAPLAGKVARVAYSKGAFKYARADEAKVNERNAVTFDTDGGPLVVEQIAGFVARRIACWVAPGDSVAQGQRYGMIYFGSQSSVTLGPAWEFVVRPGDRVVGGLTPVARRGAR
jgi:phosphatidylserine decarboxylase